MNEKTYVDMVVVQYKSGSMKPLFLVWENGKKYSVDKVLDVRQAASLKCGGRGVRYTCLIAGRTRQLFLEEDRWFIERER